MTIKEEHLKNVFKAYQSVNTKVCNLRLTKNNIIVVWKCIVCKCDASVKSWESCLGYEKRKCRERSSVVLKVTCQEEQWNNEFVSRDKESNVNSLKGKWGQSCQNGVWKTL